jgi:hypothetical protein
MVTFDLHGPGETDKDGSLAADKRAGFTIVEVIFAFMILALGALGMAGTTVLMVRQTTLADVTTDRAAALQTTIERIRAQPFDSLTAGSDSVGLYQIDWTVRDGLHWKGVDIVTIGPGLSSASGLPGLAPSVSDTFSYWVLRQ